MTVLKLTRDNSTIETEKRDDPDGGLSIYNAAASEARLKLAQFHASEQCCRRRTLRSQEPLRTPSIVASDLSASGEVT
jgi:hypothetical protein